MLYINMFQLPTQPCIFICHNIFQIYLYLSSDDIHSLNEVNQASYLLGLCFTQGKYRLRNPVVYNPGPSRPLGPHQSSHLQSEII